MKFSHSKELQTKIDEALDTIEAIKGEEFRDYVSWLLQCSQAMRLVGIAAHELADKNEEFANHLFRMTGEAFAAGSGQLSNALKFSDEMDDEAINWLKTLDGHINKALKEANE